VHSEDAPDANAVGLRSTLMATYDAVKRSEDPAVASNAPSRIALVSFSSAARLIMPLAAHGRAEFEAAVNENFAWQKLQGLTNHGAAIEEAARALEAAAPSASQRSTIVLLVTDGATTMGVRQNELVKLINEKLRALASKPKLGVIFVGNELNKLLPSVADVLGDGAPLWYSSESFDATATIDAVLERVCGNAPFTCAQFKCPLRLVPKLDQTRRCGAVTSFSEPACCKRLAEVVTTRPDMIILKVAAEFCLTVDELRAANPTLGDASEQVPNGMQIALPKPVALCNAAKPFIDCVDACCDGLGGTRPTCDVFTCPTGSSKKADAAGVLCSGPSECSERCCVTGKDCSPPLVESPFFENGRCSKQNWRLLHMPQHGGREPPGVTVERVAAHASQQCELKHSDPENFYAWWEAPKNFVRHARIGNVLVFYQRTTLPAYCEDGAPDPRTNKCPRGTDPAVWNREAWKENERRLADVVVEYRNGDMLGMNYPEAAQWSNMYRRMNLVGPARNNRKETGQIRRQIDFSARVWSRVRNDNEGKLWIPAGEARVRLRNEAPVRLVIRAEYVRGDWGMAAAGTNARRSGETNYLSNAMICEAKNLARPLAQNCDWFVKNVGCGRESEGVTEANALRAECFDDLPGDAECNTMTCPTLLSYKQMSVDRNRSCLHSFEGLNLPRGCMAACSRRNEWKNAGCGAPLPRCAETCCRK
jgi:phage tail protein X